MKWSFVFAGLIPVTPVMAQPTAPTAFCPYGQTCQSGTPSVPFPVINPVQGLNNVLTLPLQNNQPPPPANLYAAPIATPPPEMPPQR